MIRAIESFDGAMNERAFLVERRAVVGDRTVHAEEPAGSTSGRRSASDFRDPSCLEERLPLDRLPEGIWSAYDGLQPIQPMVPQAVLDQDVRSLRERRRCQGERLDRFNLYQGAARGVRRKRGPKAQDIGPSRGGQTTKLHALTDVIGRPFALRLTPGNVADVKAAPLFADEMRGAGYLIADKGYDANALRTSLRAGGTCPVIPGRSNRKRAIDYDKVRYRDRHLIENGFCRLKDYRRVATRYDKLSRNFLSAVALATLVAFWL